MESQRLGISPTGVQNNVTLLPSDVLLLIFEELVSDRLHLPWPQAQYDSERARAPFVLAQVCTLWRQLALDTASLWAYLGFPDSSQPIAELELRIARSKDAPVDIYFQLRSFSPDSDGARCIALLHMIAPRWRQVYIDYPHTSDLEDIPLLWLTECATPYLHSLTLKSFATGAYDSPTLHGVLPHAPRLRRVFVDDLAINWELHNRSAAAVTYISIYICSWPADMFYTFLSPVAQTLKTLALLGRSGQLYDIAPAQADLPRRLILPNLIRLVLHDTQWLGHIRTPNLRRLEFCTSSLDPSRELLLQPLVSIDTLVLWGYVPASLLGHVQSFVNVTHLKFAVASESYQIYGHGWEGDNSIVPAEFLNCLSGTISEPLIWPQLQRVSFGNDSDPLPQRAEIDLESLSSLVHRGRDSNKETKQLQLHVAPTVVSHELRDAVKQLMRTEPDRRVNSPRETLQNQVNM